MLYADNEDFIRTVKCSHKKERIAPADTGAIFMEDRRKYEER